MYPIGPGVATEPDNSIRWLHFEGIVMGLTFRERIRRREMRQILYRMRRRWGVEADLYQVNPGEPDIDLGTTTDVKTKIHIPQFITWLVTESQKFEYDLSFVAANKNFTYGAFFQVGDRFGIIDGKYLPDNFDLTENDYVVYDSLRYDLQRWDVLDAKSGFLLHLRHVKGTAPSQIIEKTVIQDLVVNQKFAHEITGQSWG